MAEYTPDDLTAPLVEPDPKYGKFVPDPSEPLVQRYIPAADELERLECWLKDELDRAYEDARPERDKKLSLLRSYWAQPEAKEQIVVLPLVKRAVNQNVAWQVNTIMQHKPLVTVTPDSNEDIQVLVQSPMGPMPVPKTSEEVAKAMELWFEYKLRKCLPFRKVVYDATMECKRGQTPTAIKIVHKKDSRVARSPKFEAQGPIAVSFSSKEDERIDLEATQFLNVSTYNLLFPADAEDEQESRWMGEALFCSPDEMRASLYNGEFFLIDKKERDEILKTGVTVLNSEAVTQKQTIERKVPSRPREGHDTYEVWFDWVVPMKKTIISSDPETGEQTSKTIRVNQEYPMVARFHRTLGRLLSLIRNPYDHGQRPYVLFFDRKEPFRLAGGSVAEDVAPIQRVVSQLNSLEIRGGVVATTPVTFAEPGSIAGEWLTENDAEPGSIIPRQRPDEVEMKTLGERPVSLLGLIQHHYSQYERDTSIGDLQLGLNVPGRTPASSIAQVLNQGETQASLSLENFRDGLAKCMKLYVQTVQQYMRFGEVIPFDAETAATVKAALSGEGNQVPVRFPQQPIRNEFAFVVAASADDRSAQNDFDKLVALKNIIMQDGQMIAQVLQPLASGQLPPIYGEILLYQLTRSERVMRDIAKTMRKDGDDYAIPASMIQALSAEMEQMQMMQQQQQMMAAQNGGMNGPPSGPVVPNGGAVPPPADNAGAMGGAVPQPGVS